MKIAIAGAGGLMGQAFARRFLAQGHQVDAWNRDPGKLEALLDDLLDEAGAQDGERLHVCRDIEELLDRNETLILMLSDAAAIDHVLRLDEARPLPLQGKTLIQMSTISPQQSRRLADKLTAAGCRYLEAPVLGSLPEAHSGSLIIMAGGQRGDFKRLLPVLEVLGANSETGPRYIGDTGSAAALKLAMNQLIAALTAGFSLSLGYALRNGVDADLFMDTVRASALYARTYDKKLEKYLSRDFGQANFSTRHLLKDIRLFLEDADAAGLNTQALAGIESITAQAVNSDAALLDYSSIFNTICPAEAADNKD